MVLTGALGREIIMRAALVLLTAFLVMPVDTQARTINVRGEDVARCSAWTDAHTRKTDRYPVQDSWLLAFVNATSAMLDIPSIDDVSAKFHNRDLVAWIDDYCAARPDEVLVRAADSLMKELRRLATQGDATPPGEQKH